MKSLLRVFLVSFLPLCLCAQIPEGYYSRANGKKKAELKAAMKAIIGKAKVLDYGSGAGKTWSGFYKTDRYNGNQVRDRYSNEVFYFPSSTGVPSGMNIEHSFPKSWWGGTENQAYKDLFNLMPSEKNINSSKGNFIMGKVKTVKTDNGCTKVGVGDAGGTSATVWEPADKWKGDFARTYFYMVTSYSDFSWKTEGTKMLEGNSWPTLKKWAYELFVEWSRQDPVDEIERERNEAVFGIQGNRNPFVDYPNLAEYIWGDSVDYAFSVSGSSTVVPDQPDEPQEGSFKALEPDEVVSSIYSCRFDARWERYQDGVTYTLDVYTKDNSGKQTSLDGFPVTTRETSYRVKEGVKPSTTYYYQVFVYDDKGQIVAQSNEVRFDFPAADPIFTVTPTQAVFACLPDKASSPVKFAVTMMNTEEKSAYAEVGAPFELSLDAEDGAWSQTVTFSGTTDLYVRLTPQKVGRYSGELTLRTKGVENRVVTLSATVDEQCAFLEDFETGGKGAYSLGTVRCTAATWKMSDALIGKDKYAEDLYALRMKGSGYAEMQDDKLGGCDSLWFYAGNYNTDSGTTLTVSYSLDGGATWHPIVTDLSFDKDTWQRYGYEVHKDGAIRLKFEGGGVAGKRVNVDNIQMSDYTGSTGIGQVSLTTNEAAYDLYGRRVDLRKAKGLVIVGGKKLIVK